MSAPEKLKVLERSYLRITPLWIKQLTDDKQSHEVVRAWDAEVVIDALPQILAVVEAAYNFDVRFEERLRGLAEPLNQALADLDKALP